MAVSFKTDASYGYKLLDMFGVDPGLISTAMASGVVVEQVSPGAFSVCKDGKSFGVISIKGQAISMAKSGTLGPASKQSIQYQFASVLTKALKEAGVPVPAKDATAAKELAKSKNPILASYDDIPVGEDAFKKVKQVMSSDLEELFATPKKVPKAVIHSPTEVIPLENATALFQKVQGTSSGSIYRVVAVLKGAALAARVKGPTVSFRFAGPSLNKFKPQLQSVGFKVADSYASVHFNITDQSLRDKTLGAICGALGFDKIIEVGTLEGATK